MIYWLKICVFLPFLCTQVSLQVSVFACDVP